MGNACGRWVGRPGVLNGKAGLAALPVSIQTNGRI
jgi:hypothetical protein